ncbi:MAG: hypothetical protein H6815_09565 [Phycisphaeraceae bacterium]|nr:hypothetical protein [Phycisphaerales bacterium]MCB9860685.1 hypothetical protein [Phycisphaeraceae bacterium]
MNDTLDIIVLVYAPESMPADWERTSLWNLFSDIPGVHVVSDYNGEEIQQFGASTSGECLLFDPSGNLVFSGGITGARGHVGDNAGSANIVAFSRGHQIHTAQTPVFGCSILGNQNELPSEDCALELTR